MVNRGVSFKDVADVLGHRSLQSTGIYAKLDVEALGSRRPALDGRCLMSRQYLPASISTPTSACGRLSGFRCGRSARYYPTLSAFSRPTPTAGPIRAQCAVDWACASSGQRGPGGTAQRLSMARGFLTYLRAILPDTEVPASGLVASFRRPKPYLLTSFQITALIQAAQQIGPRDSLRPHTCATVIGLLASTGLRIGETLRLTRADVQWETSPASCTFVRPKFHKSRFVPLHPTTAAQLQRYSTLRTALCYDALADMFFVSEQGDALTYHAIRPVLPSSASSLVCGPPREDAARPCMPYGMPSRLSVSAAGIRRASTCRPCCLTSPSIWATSVPRKVTGI